MFWLYEFLAGFQCQLRQGMGLIVALCGAAAGSMLYVIQEIINQSWVWSD